MKPSRGGSALGASAVHSASDLAAAIVGCFGYGDTALVERLIPGTEIAVAVVDLGDGPRAAARRNRGPRGRYGYTARYTAGQTGFYAPARLPDDIAAEAARAAVTAHVALGLRDLSRTDLIIGSSGTAYFLEVNVASGMTSTSTLPIAMRADGLDFTACCRMLLERAAARMA